MSNSDMKRMPGGPMKGGPMGRGPMGHGHEIVKYTNR